MIEFTNIKSKKFRLMFISRLGINYNNKEYIIQIKIIKFIKIFFFKIKINWSLRVDKFLTERIKRRINKIEIFNL